jgi:hypothetical protein
VSLVGRVFAGLAAFGGIGTLAVAVAIGIAPDRVVEAVPVLNPLVAATRDLGGQVVLAAASAAVGLVATYLSRRGRTSPDRATDPVLDARRTRPAETVTVDPGTVTGGAIQSAYDDVSTAAELDAVAADLRETAVAVEEAVTGVDHRSAARRVEAGKWTDDAVAAAVLGEEAPLPVTARLRAWLDPEAEVQRRLRRTVAAVETRLDGGGPGE